MKYKGKKRRCVKINHPKTFEGESQWRHTNSSIGTYGTNSMETRNALGISGENKCRKLLFSRKKELLTKSVEKGSHYRGVWEN